MTESWVQTISGDCPKDIGQLVTFDCAAYWTDDTLAASVTINFGDGISTSFTPVSKTFQVTHTYLVGGEYDVLFDADNHIATVRVTTTCNIQCYYVKTTGDDTKDGRTWANAWETINKVATTVPDGSFIFMGHGTYNNEPASNKIAPQNAASLGVRYKPVTADTGAEVAGSVTIEKN